MIFTAHQHSKLCKHCTNYQWDLLLSICHMLILSQWPKQRSQYLFTEFYSVNPLKNHQNTHHKT